MGKLEGVKCCFKCENAKTIVVPLVKEMFIEKTKLKKFITLKKWFILWIQLTKVFKRLIKDFTENEVSVEY